MNNWTTLYQMADLIKALKPWRYMYEDEITGVRDPVTDTIGFISVMGNLGEHYSIAVYLGERALGQYFELSEKDESEDDENAVAEMLLEIPQLMLTFEDREFLEKEDLSIIKELGRKYSGKKSWPLFRSCRPGMVPWFLDEKERESMVVFLGEFLETAIRTKSGTRMPKLDSKGNNVYLVRELRKDSKNQQWHETRQKIAIPAPQEVLYTLDNVLLAKIKKIPVGKNIYEMDFFLTPAQVKEKNKRPFFSYLFLIVDQRSEFIITHEMMDPTEGIESMLAKIPSLLLNTFNKSTSLPQAVYVGSSRLAHLLIPLLRNLDIPVQYHPNLKSLQNAKRGIMGYFRKG